MSGSIEVQLPADSTPGQIMACEATLVAALGYQLGERYESDMCDEHGVNWLEDLRQARLLSHNPAPLYKKKLNLHDFSFCLTEPAKNGNSPLRRCLNGGAPLYGLMDDAVKLRNETLHGNAAYNLDELEQWAKVFGEIAVLNALPIASACAKVAQRISKLRAGEFFESDTPGGLDAQLADQERKAAALAAEVSDLRKQLKDVERAGASDAGAAADLEQKLRQAELEKSASEEALRLAQAALEAQRAAEREAARLREAIEHLQPGEPWPDAPPSRALRLLPFVRDLFDPKTDDLLSNQIGRAATEAADQWVTLLPHGEDVLVTPGGHGVALIGGTWTYLGRLDAA